MVALYYRNEHNPNYIFFSVFHSACSDFRRYTFHLAWRLSRFVRTFLFSFIQDFSQIRVHELSTNRKTTCRTFWRMGRRGNNLNSSFSAFWFWPRLLSFTRSKKIGHRHICSWLTRAKRIYFIFASLPWKRTPCPTGLCRAWQGISPRRFGCDHFVLLPLAERWLFPRLFSLYL